jgi:hypothetical protein
MASGKHDQNAAKPLSKTQWVTGASGMVKRPISLFPSGLS